MELTRAAPVFICVHTPSLYALSQPPVDTLASKNFRKIATPEALFAFSPALRSFLKQNYMHVHHMTRKDGCEACAFYVGLFSESEIS